MIHKEKKRKQEGGCVAGCILWPVFQLVSSRWKRRRDGKNVGTVGNDAAPPDLLYLLSHHGRQRLSHQSGSCLWRYLSSLVICLMSLFSSISASVKSGSFSNRSENHASPIHTYKEGSDAHSHAHVQWHSNHVYGLPANLTINPSVMSEVDMTLWTATLSKTLHFKHTDRRIHTD